MPKIPDYNLPKFKPWKPDKAEVHNLRYWKAKPAAKKKVTKPKKAKLPEPYKQDYAEMMRKMRAIQNEEW